MHTKQKVLIAMFLCRKTQLNMMNLYLLYISDRC